MSHDRWLESATAYALDALDAGEVAAFEAHLVSCAECRRAVQEHREVTGLLMYASAPATAPAALRDRISGLVRQERPATRQASNPWRAPATWLAAAGVVFALAAGWMWRRVSQERDAALVARLGLERSLAARDSLLDNLLATRVHVVSLAAPGDTVPVARVFWNHERGRFMVTAFRLPRARAGRTYQLWAIASGHAPVSMGTFDTDSSGHATLTLPVGQDINALGFIDACGLTEEPAGGSSAPTETPRFLGTWRHTD